MYRTILRQAGYTVIAVQDGIAALHSIEERRPAAVVLDMVLPQLSGRDVHQELKARAETRDIPIIVVSGHDISDLNASEFACVLRKPLNPDSLLSAVEDCIRRAR
jgi:DNA-binding response OmpR family regulator